MTIAILLVIAATVSLIVILRIGVLPGLQIARGERAVGRIEPLDIEAFRNLADPGEDEYLRRRLPAGEFRRVRRTRLHAVAAYVQVAARNAAVLIRVGQSAAGAADGPTAAAARELVEDALLLRRNALLALVRIYLALAWPSEGYGLSPVLEGYQQLNGSAMLLGRLQNPAVPVRISA